MNSDGVGALCIKEDAEVTSGIVEKNDLIWVEEMVVGSQH